MYSCIDIEEYGTYDCVGKLKVVSYSAVQIYLCLCTMSIYESPSTCARRIMLYACASKHQTQILLMHLLSCATIPYM